MTRHVVVDATALGPEPSGAKRRLSELLPRLAARMPEDVFEVHWARDGGGPPAGLDRENLVHAVTEVSCRGGARRWWRRRRALARRHREAPYTHLLVDHGPVPRLPGVRTTVTLHDLRFLRGYGGPVRAIYGRIAYGRLLRRAAAVVAVSPSVAAEAIRRYDLDARRVTVAPNAPSTSLRPRQRGAPGGPLLLVARDEPRKACDAALAAARRAGLDLVHVQGELDDAALAERYAEARWLLAPSREEGFDLPVVEALAAGTPVLASDIPAHRDLVALGARGLVLVAPPAREGGRWRWPEAVEALGRPPPVDVAPPDVDWDRTADLVVGAIALSPPAEGA